MRYKDDPRLVFVGLGRLCDFLGDRGYLADVVALLELHGTLSGGVVLDIAGGHAGEGQDLVLVFVFVSRERVLVVFGYLLGGLHGLRFRLGLLGRLLRCAIGFRGLGLLGSCGARILGGLCRASVPRRKMRR